MSNQSKDNKKHKTKETESENMYVRFITVICVMNAKMLSNNNYTYIHT